MMAAITMYDAYVRRVIKMMLLGIITYRHKKEMQRCDTAA
jgi:hypothetical protein